jgi:flagella basal body P-ring formation protein FlgA
MEIGIRIALFLLTIAFGAFVLMASAHKVLAASLKAEGIVQGDHLLLGDIFDGVENADYVLGPAPQPGKDMVLNARTLYKIASALNVDWKPANSTEQIVLRREAVIIPQTAINALLEDKIRENGVKEGFNIQYVSAADHIVLPAGEEETAEVTSLQFDAQNDSFKAVVVAPSAQNPLKKINVSGHIDRMVSVPVLKNTLKNGDIIGGNDIDYLELPKNRVSNGVLVNEGDIMNMTPRRTIASGKPIMSNDLEQPKMVDRGEAITLIFSTGAMTLTAKGKSLQSGAMGDTVRVTNLDSNKNLQGTVTAHREVTIQ